LTIVTAVVATAIALMLTPAEVAAGVGPDVTAEGFLCSPPPGINLPATTNSYEYSQGGHIRIACYFTYKAGKVGIAGLAGFPCSFEGTPLPASTAYFGRTSGSMGCSN
jgi:hypothetical protein